MWRRRRCRGFSRGCGMSEFVTLGDCITIQKGKAPLETGYSGAGAKLYLNPEYLRGRATAELARPKSDSVHARDGDTILLWDGSNAGEFFKAKTGLVASTMAKVIPNVNFNSSYFLHVVKHVEIFLRGQTNGTGIPHVDREILEAIRVFCPMSAEQKCLAEILDHLDTTIHETEAIIAKLKAVKQGLLHDLLTRGIDANGELRPPQAEAPHLYKESPLGWIPNEWTIEFLGDIAEVCRGKFTHRPRNDPRFYGGIHPFIQTGDVAAAEGEFVSTYSQTLSDRGVSVSQEFPIGTIAITIAANIADTAILAMPMYFPDSVVGAIVGPQNSVRFVELSIRKAKRMLDARAPQSAQKNINLQDLRPLPMALPGKPEQDEIATRYEAIQAKLQYEQEALAKYQREKSGLMDDLLTGRVRVTPLLEGNAP